MNREFEGKTEQEAIALAVAELQLDDQDFDVEILDTGRKGIFKKSNVRIRIHLEGDDATFSEEETAIAPENEAALVEFLAGIIERMGLEAEVEVTHMRDGKLSLSISSDDSALIIGRKGKNLDALQLLVNVYAGRLKERVKVIVDSENYRLRHEEQIVRTAFRTAEQVKRSGKSRLLEPMNPFERRLIHTALNDIIGVGTKSEGEGLYKQVRIFRDDETPPLRY